MRCSAGMMCLNAWSPVIPEDDNRIALLAAFDARWPPARRSSWPPEGTRATDDGVSARSHAPPREKRSERPAMTASRRDAPHWSIPTTTIISEPQTALIGFGSTAGSKRLALAPVPFWERRRLMDQPIG
jgi:hypothetical protein